MDRERLIKKRKALQAKLQIADCLSHIDELIQYLNEHEIKYRIHIECEKVLEALLAYPTNFSGLNWAHIPNSQKAAYCSVNERNKIISATVTHNLKKSDTVFIVWGDGNKPTLEMSAEFAAENSGVMADQDFDMWILNLEKGFCLEHYHEGYVAWVLAS